MMQPNALPERELSLHHNNHHILIIEDNTQLRSVLARHIMLNCKVRRRSCAIYRLGERPEPYLTYFEYEDPALASLNTPDFSVYETATPRNALNWLSRNPVSPLTIITDVIMHGDTEVGLPGLLAGLHKLGLPVKLVFVSVEGQARNYLQLMLNEHPSIFLVKGSEAWNRLPLALVEEVENFHYFVPPLPDNRLPLYYKPGLKLPALSGSRKTTYDAEKSGHEHGEQDGGGSLWTRLIERVFPRSDFRIE